MSLVEEAPVDVPPVETADRGTGIFILIFPGEGIAFLRRQVFSGFLSAFNPCSTPISLPEPKRLTPSEAIYAGEVDSAVWIDNATMDGWVVNKAEPVLLTDFFLLGASLEEANPAVLEVTGTPDKAGAW